MVLKVPCGLKRKSLWFPFDDNADDLCLLSLNFRGREFGARRQEAGRRSGMPGPGGYSGRRGSSPGRHTETVSSDGLAQEEAG